MQWSQHNLHACVDMHNVVMELIIRIQDLDVLYMYIRDYT